MPRAWSIHTVVFDLDDTLYPERDYVISGFNAVGRWLKAENIADHFEAHAEKLFDAGVRGTIFDEALGALGVSADADLIRRMVTVYREHAPEISLPPASEDVLVWCRGLFRLAIVSDGFLGVQQRKAHALRLSRWKPFTVFTDIMGRNHWKPHPWGFLEVMRHAPGPAEGFVYVGDNPTKDFEGPRGLGWRTVRLRTPGAEHAHVESRETQAAHLEISSLLELKSCIS